MILHIKNDSPILDLQKKYQAYSFKASDHTVMVTSSSIKSIETQDQQWIIESFTFDSDIQLASSKYIPKRTIQLSDSIAIGGDTKNTVMISGPCSVESESQIDQVAQFMVQQGVGILRAGCYKPRTSPYTFQGLGHEGLMMLVQMRNKYGLKIITEAKDSTHIDDVIEHTDIVQIGAKAMYDHGILNACAQSQKPILLKRGFGSTLQEFVQSAEFILSGGNPNVILCERGIRTFETKTRFSLDLCGVAFLKEHTNLPIILDPSHAMGYSYGVSDLARACVAMGVDGLLIETHPIPTQAKSDASQQLDFIQFESLNRSLRPIANAIGYQMV